LNPTVLPGCKTWFAAQNAAMTFIASSWVNCTKLPLVEVKQKAVPVFSSVLVGNGNALVVVGGGVDVGLGVQP
jgi:hypothetical protein